MRRVELDKFGAACRARPELGNVVQSFFDAMLPRGNAEASMIVPFPLFWNSMALTRLNMNKFGGDLKESRIKPAQNRLPSSAIIEDVHPGDVSGAFDLKGPEGGRLLEPAKKGQDDHFELGLRLCATEKLRLSTLAAAPEAVGHKAPEWSKLCIRFVKIAGAIERSSKRTWPKAADFEDKVEQQFRTFLRRVILLTSPRKNSWPGKTGIVTRVRCIYLRENR